MVIGYMKYLTREILIAALIIVALFLALRFTLQSYEVKGSSMEPNIYEGQYFLVNKAVYFFRSPHRGDVVVCHRPIKSEDVYIKSEDVYIKRVIGLPGETIEITKGKVYINGEPLEEPYLEEFMHDYHRCEIPDNHYFVLGDNRDGSSDSRAWGPVPEGYIVGKAWLCYWPSSEWGLAPNYSLAMD